MNHARVMASLAALALVGCGASPDEFREADSTGYEACAAFDESRGAGGETYHALVGEAAERGLEADSQALRAAVDDRNGGADGSPVIQSLDAFQDACEDAGYDFD